MVKGKFIEANKVMSHHSRAYLSGKSIYNNEIYAIRTDGKPHNLGALPKLRYHWRLALRDIATVPPNFPPIKKDYYFPCYETEEGILFLNDDFFPLFSVAIPINFSRECTGKEKKAMDEYFKWGIGFGEYFLNKVGINKSKIIRTL